MRGLAFHKPFCTFILIIEPLRARETNAIFCMYFPLFWKLLVTCFEENLFGFHCVFCKPIVKQYELQCPCHHWFGKIVNALWMNLNFEDAWYYMLLLIIGNHFYCEWVNYQVFKLLFFLFVCWKLFKGFNWSWNSTNPQSAKMGLTNPQKNPTWDWKSLFAMIMFVHIYLILTKKTL